VTQPVGDKAARLLAQLLAEKEEMKKEEEGVIAENSQGEVKRWRGGLTYLDLSGWGCRGRPH